MVGIQMRGKIMGIVVTAVISIGLLSSSQAYGQFFYMENLDIGKPVKDFSLKMMDGNEGNLTKYRDGKNAIVFFWATWCPHCREELKEMNAMKEDFEKKDIRLVIVNSGEKEKIVKNYVEKHNIKLDMFLDVDSEVTEEYDIFGLPTFYFVRKDGIVADVLHSIPENLDKVFSNT